MMLARVMHCKICAAAGFRVKATRDVITRCPVCHEEYRTLACEMCAKELLVAPPEALWCYLCRQREAMRREFE